MVRNFGFQLEESIHSVLKEFEIPYKVPRGFRIKERQSDIVIPYPGGRVMVDIKYNSRPIVALADEERWPNEKTKIHHVKSWLNEEYGDLYHSVSYLMKA